MNNKKGYEKGKRNIIMKLDVFKMNLEPQRSRLTGDHHGLSKGKTISSRSHSNNQHSINKTPILKKDFLKENIKISSERLLPKDDNSFQFEKGNININVNNLIINNPGPSFNNFNHLGSHNDLFQYSVFSKLGNDIMTKSPSSYKKMNKSPPKIYPYQNMTKKKFGQGSNLVENVIEELIDLTKEKQSKSNYPPQQSPFHIKNKINSSMGELNDGSNNNLNLSPINKESCVMVGDNTIAIHSMMWEVMLDMEVHSENKIILQTILRNYMTFLTDEVLKHLLTFDLFNVPILNNAYQKLTKVSFIMLVYIQFILLDFNYQMTIKTCLKRMISSLNEYLVLLLESELFINSNLKSPGCKQLSQEFIEKYQKAIRVHKKTKNKDTSLAFGSYLFKNLEIAINTIKQFSNNFFKNGNFSSIHNICFEMFRLLDVYTVNSLVNIIINNVLFYIIRNTIAEKNQPQISIKQRSFPQNALNPLGFMSITPPFLPPVNDSIYTLALDLDETLAHCFYTPSGGTFLIRPGCHQFLAELAHCYEITIFTAAMKDYADSIIDILDPEKKLIRHRLYRHHTSISGISFVKDLSRLGRDLSKIIIVDNIPGNFKLQQNNGLAIQTWKDDMGDTQLVDICKILKDIYLKKLNDVRPIIKKLNEDVGKKMKRNVLNPYSNIDITKYLI